MLFFAVTVAWTIFIVGLDVYCFQAFWFDPNFSNAVASGLSAVNVWVGGYIMFQAYRLLK